MSVLMSPRLLKLYKLAKEDKVFCDRMSESEGNSVPNILSDDTHKLSFAAMYSGWVLHLLSAEGYHSLYVALGKD